MRRLILMIITSITLLSGYTINQNYINKVVMIGSGSSSDIVDIPQKAGYNFVITHISALPYMSNTSVLPIPVNFIVNDSTWSWNLNVLYLYKLYDEWAFTSWWDRTAGGQLYNYENNTEIKITWIININNLSNNDLILSISGYYLAEDWSYIAAVIKNELLSADIPPIISIIILYWIYLYIIYYTYILWFISWKNFIFHKFKKW